MRATLKHELRTQGQAKLKALRDQEELLAISLAQLRNSTDFTKKALIDGNDLKLLPIKQQLIQRLAQLNASQFHCKPCNSDYLKLKLNKRISDIEKMATLVHAPDATKCVLSMVGGEESVLYQTFAGQPVDFKFAIAGGTAVKEPETGFMVRASVKREEQQESQELSVCDKGDGSYFFSYQAETAGICTLSVTIKGESVHGSLFTWEVMPNIKGPNELDDTLHRQRRNGKTKHYWKLKYLGSIPGISNVEIGVDYPHRHFDDYRNTWCCQNNVDTTCRGYQSRDDVSMTSLQNDDILSAYLTYNHRNEQSEIFHPVNGYTFSSVIISPYTEPSEGGFTFAIV